ncbi:MAG: hypothetical protein RSE14_00880 [Erythrobacter sp.]|jgi:hypothetical protein|uniref:hypothetical protein n=1 Tax=Erythrobacter sp. TaxID=1042 RepID=UPI002B462F98|nr:hypothetical protein [Erythrobacter sp.]WRH70678.1 MAG: hypothetical protein RSE14_00880 [Erythrobacter sp.]
MNWLRLGFVPAALALAVPLMASELQPISADVTGARLAQLLEIDFIRVTKRAFNLGLLTQDLGYTLAVAADGTVTNCQLSRSFRNPITTREMCRSITRAVTLAPARDAAGNPVSGTYQGMIRIQSPFAATQ